MNDGSSMLGGGMANKQQQVAMMGRGMGGQQQQQMQGYEQNALMGQVF